MPGTNVTYRGKPHKKLQEPNVVCPVCLSASGKKAIISATNRYLGFCDACRHWGTVLQPQHS